MRKEIKIWRPAVYTYLLLLGACSSHVASKAEYVKFVEDKDNGFRKEQVIDHWQYKVQYKPSSYIVLHEKTKGLSKTEFNTRMAQLKDWRFFNVYVQHDSVKKSSPLRLVSNDLESYNNNLAFYLSQNKANFILFADSTAIYPVVYQYENDYSLTPEDVFVIGFRMPKQLLDKKPERLVLQYDDELLKNGMIRFVFRQHDLEKEPTLTFNQLTYE